MKTCDYCGKEDKKAYFCSSAHKMAFRRGTVLRESNKDSVVLPKSNKPVVKPEGQKWCKHGALIGLCKYGCTK